MKYANQSAAGAVPFKRLLLAVAMSGSLVVPPSWAGELRELDQTIFGMDCSPCAAGVEKALRKLDGVTAVRVSLNEGKAVVAFAPDSRATLTQIRAIIRHNGFTPKDARATLVGRLIREGERLWIDTGSGRFVLQSESNSNDTQALLNKTSQAVRVSVRVPEELTNPPTVLLVATDLRT